MSYLADCCNVTAESASIDDFPTEDAQYFMPSPPRRDRVSVRRLPGLFVELEAFDVQEFRARWWPGESSED